MSIKMPTADKMKKFYTLVSTETRAGGVAVLLDGRAIKTPARADLLAPNQNIADVVVGEWSAQTEFILPDTMPLTQMLSTKIDRVRGNRSAMTDLLMKYLNTDLLCYRTEAPVDLAAQQAKIWDQWLEWFASEYGAVLKITTGLSALTQDNTAYEKVLVFVKNLDEDRFTILQLVTVLSGSLVLALAFLDGAANVGDVFTAWRVDETFKDTLYKEEIHGGDPMQNKRDITTRRDLDACEKYLTRL